MDAFNYGGKYMFQDQGYGAPAINPALLDTLYSTSSSAVAPGMSSCTPTPAAVGAGPPGSAYPARAQKICIYMHRPGRQIQEGTLIEGTLLEGPLQEGTLMEVIYSPEGYIPF